MAEKKGTVAEVLRDAADLVKRYRSPLLLAGLTLVSFLLLWRAVPIPVQILLAAAGVCAAFGCSRRSALVYLVLLGLFTCFERHFIIHYGESFFQVGNQALITLHITDMDEVVAYLSIFKAVELLLCLLFAAGSVAVFRWGSVPPTIRRRVRSSSIRAPSFFRTSRRKPQAPRSAMSEDHSSRESSSSGSNPRSS